MNTFPRVLRCRLTENSILATVSCFFSHACVYEQAVVGLAFESCLPALLVRDQSLFPKWFKALSLFGGEQQEG